MRKQLRLNLNNGKWGGRRENSGRKRLRSAGVAHRRRERVNSRTPLHVNFKFRTSVRNKETLKLLKKAIKNARGHGLKVLHFSFQSNHVHLILEASTNEILTRGMRSLTITFAKGLHMGRIQVERYHLHVLRTISETKNAIHYVLFNQQLHEKGRFSEVNEYTSLLSLKEGLQLLKNYARKKRVWFKIERSSTWVPDPAKSFLAQKGMARLII